MLRRNLNIGSLKKVLPMVDKNDSPDKPSLSDLGIFLFSGEVDTDLTNDAISFILESNYEKNRENLTLIVNSEGGYVNSGFGLISIMEGSSIPIYTVGLGMIASMGLNIFIAGHKGTRTLTPNTLIISHQWSGGRVGKEHELIASQKRDNIISEMILKHYRKYTGLSEKNIKKYLLPPSDVYLTAHEALKLGICDIVKEFDGRV